MGVKRAVRDGIARVVEARTAYRTVGPVTWGRDVKGIGTTSFEGANLVHTGVEIFGDVSVGRATTIGTRAHISGPASIGRYCQLAPEVAVYGVNHPTSHVTTYVNRELLGGVVGRFNDVRPVSIGHDVWIGHGAMVVPGVTIGHGAVVAGRAVVTRDVAPYDVVGGNPARVLRSRFDPEVVALLLASRWWDASADRLAAHRAVFEADLTDPANRSLVERFAGDLGG